ncbi:GNAT family N-acetyltransferase [Streptomyces sp. MJM1172]|uniref:GNAT family N-acetyltransferase n=1 Tax=Streptomyces sp. MJM1172 TaxID=1703926 RepID=UPI000965EA1F|nr:GNAT family N-acetyltransferase [Streptomyces sp. MJM1172]OKI57776.1 GCN5 family acetyltransferase [Streptomyces sp. MJM1172]
MPFAHTAEAVHAWVHGWSASRGAAEPAPSAWGFTIDVGLSGHVMRHVLHSADEATVRKITENTTTPGVWLKAFVPPETLERWLAPGWHLAGGAGHLMSAPLPVAPTRAPSPVPEGYRMDTWTRDGVTRALVRTTDGAFAARGQIAVTGHSAVVDQVETDQAHQRRGLGRLVMRGLTEAAAAQGATAGVLGATPEGRALYETTGWRVLAPLTSALRGPDPH